LRINYIPNDDFAKYLQALIVYNDGYSELLTTIRLNEAEVRRRRANGAVFMISGTTQASTDPLSSVQRSMIGVMADGTIIFLAADAGKANPDTGQGHGDGLRIREGEDILRSMGAINVLNLDGGGSAQFWYDGRIRTYPGDLWEGRGVFRQIGSVFLVFDR